jgi:hypothetical protein
MSGTDRTRFIHQWWDRAPGGKYLDKYDPPRGKRTPNGAVWGHSTDDLFMIQRIPDVNVVTCWSRSMIKEYGERPIDDGDEPDAPRVRRPYPLLKIDSDVECPERGMYDCFDEGSDHGDPVPFGDLEDKKARIEATVIELEEVVAEFEGADIVFEEADIEFEETDAEMRVDSPPQKPDQKYTHQEKHSDVHRCLEEHIPQQFFPDRLIVSDASGLAFGDGKIPKKDGEPEREWIYERLYPSFPRDLSADRFAEDPVTAELYLDAAEVVGVGHHSNVYRATLTLPKGLSARTPDGKVTVVAKTSFPRSEHRSLFHNEARVFSSFPKHLSEEWCGYNVIPPLSWPVPVGAVVPKFYGYYVPTGEKKDALSPILLMEECGSPVNPPKLTPEQRSARLVFFLSSGTDIRV